VAAVLNPDRFTLPRVEAEREYTDIELRDAIADAGRHVNATDVLDQLTDAEDVLERAIQARDVELIGKLVLGVRDTYVCRLTARVLYSTDEARHAFAPVSIEEVAQRIEREHNAEKLS
jgi:hypothetical protein